MKKTRTLILGTLLLFGLMLSAQNTTNYGTESGTQGSGNSFFGYKSGKTTTASYNTFTGFGTGQLNTTGGTNAFFGYLAGASNSTGYANTSLGAYAGLQNQTGSGNVFIGNSAGYSETGSNKLYIENTANPTPLIFGDFATDKVGINTKIIPDYASFAVTGGADFSGNLITSGKIGIGTTNPDGELDIQNGNMVIGGPHKDFIFHTQHWTDTSSRLFIAPKNDGAWDWSKNLVYHDNGDLEVNGKLRANYGLFDSSSDNGWIPVSIGREYETDRRTFEFVVAPTDTGSGYTAFAITDRSGVLRHDLVSNNTDTWIDLDNHNNKHFFKVASGDDYAYIHMPLPESRIVIGEYGGYLADEGYRLVVKNGPAMIEDNLFASGSVGIGTTNINGYQLAVNGNIRAKEIVVETGWADYVFNDDYVLPTLKQVEQHIEKNGHLINIPSAAEVEANGISLGEINAKLLEKIEELTLYTISQEKKIQSLQKNDNKLQTLTEQNKRLQERLLTIETLLQNKK
ncbi:hypothetical protein [Aquimarina pacifica]|uniref:hypothetical protein n=1 Tax=Aquimarina pacifica TaxID=1296415 RepID=UPI00046E9953|nr:hypothetical protein [Aquimarina pacifica]